MNRANAWTTYEEADIKALEGLCKEYKDFLSNGKTERECVAQSIELAKKAGYQDLEELIKNQTPLKAGDKVYRTWMEKTIVLFQMGQGAIEDGLNILGAHIDSPRLDLKQNPLYEDTEMALLDTHYYGGVKKYQWVTIPLSLYGVVCKKDGSVVDVVIGEDDNDPVVGIRPRKVYRRNQDRQDRRGRDSVQRAHRGRLAYLLDQPGQQRTHRGFVPCQQGRRYRTRGQAHAPRQ